MFSGFVYYKVSSKYIKNEKNNFYFSDKYQQIFEYTKNCKINIQNNELCENT